jgi:sugar (glycoside-pentoside-hexuronide) transporter
VVFTLSYGGIAMRINSTFTGDIVPRKTKWIFCSVSIARDAAYSLISAFLLTYITFSGVLTKSDVNQYIAQYTTISIFIVAARIWDGLNDPIMGWIIEKVHFKMGKFKPWILIGGIGNTLVILALFLIRPTGWGFVAFFCVFYFLWDFVFTMNDLGYWSMLPSLTSDEKERRSITTWMSIFISIGTFAVYGAVPFLVRAGYAANDYGIIAIVVAIVFLISQIVLVLFAQEHKRDVKQEEISEKTKFTDIFKMFKNNTQLRWSTLAILLYYCGSSLVIGFGLNYFYLTFGYGSDKGGIIQTIFTVMFAVGTLIAQFLFPALSKKFKLRTLYTASFIAIAIGYVSFFLLGFPLFGDTPIAFGDFTWLIYICAIVIFAGQGIFNLILLLYMQNSIEYNEWKTGERKEATASSLRPLTAKFGSATQQLFLWATLLGSGLLSISDTISTNESLSNSGLITAQEAATTISTAIQNIEPWQMVVMGIGMVLVSLLLIFSAYILVHKLYFIDEKKYQEIRDELAKRKAIESK